MPAAVRRAPRSGCRRGMSLVEVLVVVAIIAGLAGMLLPAVQWARESARRIACLNNLRQTGLAVQSFGDAKGRLPPGYVSRSDAAGSETGPGWGWAAFALPQLGETSLFTAIDLTGPIEAADAATARRSAVATLLCPTDAVPTAPFPVGPADGAGRLAGTTCDVAPANYVGCFGVGEPGIDGDGVFFRNSDVRLRDITDGLAGTLLVGERSFRHAASTWVGAVAATNQVSTLSAPLGVQVNNASNFVLGHTGESYGGPAGPTEINNFTSSHVDGCNFVFADGHAAFLGATVDYKTYKSLSTRAESDVVGEVN